MSLTFYMSLYVYLDFVRPGPGALRKYCQPVIASGVACFRAVREFLHLFIFYFFTLLILTMSASNWQWSEELAFVRSASFFTSAKATLRH